MKLTYSRLVASAILFFAQTAVAETPGCSGPDKGTCNFALYANQASNSYLLKLLPLCPEIASQETPLALWLCISLIDRLFVFFLEQATVA